MKKHFFIIIIFVLFGFSSCGHIDHGGGSTPSTNILTIYNPQYGTGTGTFSNWNMSNDPDYQVKVRVQTIDSNNNAVTYRTYTFNNSFSGLSNYSEDHQIEVPSNNSYFVIQVELIYSECTWQNSTCTSDEASKKTDFLQHTYTAPQINYYFNFSYSNIDYQDCGC